MNRKTYASVVLLTLLASTAGAVEGNDLDSTVGSLMAKYKIPGLSLAVIKDGAIVKA